VGTATCEDEKAWAELIRNAKAGDSEAIGTIIAAHREQVLRVAWRMLFDLDEAQDAAQEVFVRFLKYLKGLDETQNPGGWFYRVTVNVSRDVEKKRRRRQWLPMPDHDHCSAPNFAQAAADPSERLAFSEEASRVARSLKLLPAKERSVLILRDVEGLSTCEVAKILGSTEATVRSQACRAKVRLKKILEAHS
jgi:RNA polymerase sigma-70 factor (ECF subfamily)